MNEFRVQYKQVGSFPGGSMVKNPPANAGDAGDKASVPGLGRSPGGRNGNPLQYPWLENSMDKGAQHTRVHGASKSQILWRKKGNPFQNPCLDNLMDRGARQATVQGATKSQLRLSPHDKKAGVNVISFCCLIGDKIYK